MASVWAVLTAWSCSLQILTTPASCNFGSISGFILISLCTAISEVTQGILTLVSQVFHWNLDSGLYDLVTCVPCTAKQSPSWYQGLLPAQPAVRSPGLQLYGLSVSLWLNSGNHVPGKSDSQGAPELSAHLFPYTMTGEVQAVPEMASRGLFYCPSANYFASSNRLNLFSCQLLWHWLYVFPFWANKVSCSQFSQ